MEKRSRLVNIIVCAGFLALCLLLPLLGAVLGLLGFPVFSDENRQFKEPPRIEGPGDIFTFPSEFDAWFSDHIFFKSAFVEAKTMTELSLFDELDTGTVILGSERPWLFYRSKSDGQALETYKRTNLFTEGELSDIAAVLSGLEAELSAHDIEFIFYIAPDKESIYGESYMPSYIRRLPGPGSTEQLISYLHEACPDMNIVYPAERLKGADGSMEGVEYFYYETDTHWNLAGALLGTRELLDSIESIYGESYSFEGLDLGRDGSLTGDLQRLALLSESFDSTYYSLKRPLSYENEEVLKEPVTGEELYIRSRSTASEPLELSLYFCGDSFRDHAWGYMAEAFSESVTVSRYYMDMEDILSSGADVLVYEIAERYLHDLPGIPGFNIEALYMD